MSEIHLFVLWEKSRHLQESIVDDIAGSFTIRGCYDITWTPRLVTSNFSRFYGEKLPEGCRKELDCGTGEFRLVIVEDLSPKYEERQTSRGPEVVNVNAFDAKQKYRRWCTANRIHGTNNKAETDHDLTLLLGVSVEDYLHNNPQPWDGHVKKITQDIIGANGWSDINQLFYVLNHTVNYTILRGCQEVQSGSYIDHTDTDILTDQYQRFWLIANGTPCRSEVRPKERIPINGINYDLDLWDIRRNYYDIQWGQQMLRNRTLRDGIYVLDEDNNFYCLLYHCLINKNRISPDYKPYLLDYIRRNHLESISFPQIMVSFLGKGNYEILRPNDTSVGFHIEDPIINRYYNKYGKVLGKSCCIQKDIGTGKNLEWKSCVYDAGDTIVKAGTDWLIDNEVRFLRRLQSHNLAPKVLDERKEDQDAVFSMEKIKGQTLNDFFSLKYNHKRKIITSVASQIVSALTLLKDNNIVHRDFTGNNLLVDCEGNVRLIDFGWAIDTTADQFPRPEKLTSRYRPPEMYSDFYTIGAVLSEVTNYRLPYLQRLSAKLCEIQWQDYFDDRSYSAKLDAVNHALHAAFGLRDYLHCFLFRHKRISRYYNKFRRIIWR